MEITRNSYTSGTLLISWTGTPKTLGKIEANWKTTDHTNNKNKWENKDNLDIKDK